MVSGWHISYGTGGTTNPLFVMNNTGTRTKAARRPASNPTPSKATIDQPTEPDLIIIPRHDSPFANEGQREYLGRERRFEYTPFEEIETAPSSLDDELAFQEYADDDPSRLQVRGRRQA